MFQFNHCTSQHFWFIFFYHTETQVWNKPSPRKVKYFGSSNPPIVSTHPSIWQGFWSVPVSNRSNSTLPWGQEGLESWPAPEAERCFGSLLGSGGFVSKSLTSCSPQWHPDQGCLHLCPTMLLPSPAPCSLPWRWQTSTDRSSSAALYHFA